MPEIFFYMFSFFFFLLFYCMCVLLAMQCLFVISLQEMFYLLELIQRHKQTLLPCRFLCKQIRRRRNRKILSIVACILEIKMKELKKSKLNVSQVLFEFKFYFHKCSNVQMHIQWGEWIPRDVSMWVILLSHARVKLHQNLWWRLQWWWWWGDSSKSIWIFMDDSRFIPCSIHSIRTSSHVCICPNFHFTLITIHNHLISNKLLSTVIKIHLSLQSILYCI